MKFYKTAAFRIIVSVLALGLIYILLQHGTGREEPAVGGDDDIRCCIAIKSNLTSLSGKSVGFSYELLNYFADDNDLDISFARYTEDNSPWDSLSRGDIDLIVFDWNEDSISVMKYGEDLMLSVPLRGRLYAAVWREDAPLLNSLNFWLYSFKESRTYSLMVNRFFRSYNIERMLGAGSKTLSPYDDIIKRYSAFSGLDWKLVSALAWQESHYYMGTQSGTAQGLMQIKQSTAAHYGVDDLYDPELNVKAGTLHLQSLMRTYREEGLDSLNVIKFALAAYNAGEARIEECRDHAAENGYNRNDWDQVALSLENHPSFVGTRTVNYVNNILYRYSQYNELLQ